MKRGLFAYFSILATGFVLSLKLPMASYYRLRVALRGCPTLFYRVLLVKEDVTLEALGALIAAAVGAPFEHQYVFRDKNYYYVPNDWLGSTEDPKDRDLATSLLRDTVMFAGRRLFFEYDTGDSWDFDITVGLTMVEKDHDPHYPEEEPGYCLAGKGAQIFEDHHYGFDRFIEGKRLKKDDLPWDYQITTLKAFLAPIDPILTTELMLDGVEMNRIVKEKYENPSGQA